MPLPSNWQNSLIESIRNNCLKENDEVQDMLPQNMAPWHVEYFKLKGFEKWQVQEGPSDLYLSSPQNPQCMRCPPCTGRKGGSSSPKKEEHQRNRNERPLLSSPSLLPLAHTPFCLITFFHDSTTLHQTWYKSTQAEPFLCFSFSVKSPVSHKTYIKSVCMLFFLLICLLLQRLSWVRRVEGKDTFPPLQSLVTMKGWLGHPTRSGSWQKSMKELPLKIMWEMPFLYPEEKSIPLLEDGWTLRRIWRNWPC